MSDGLIEVDPSVLNTDGTDYETAGYETSTQSLTSSVNQYVFENGRRYHAYYGIDKNVMPTDEIEQDRLDLHHESMLQMLKGDLYKAPLEEPTRILDVGTGTGIWAIDMADKFPAAEVIGIDLSPIQPRWVPPNCRFETDDAEQEWTYDPNSFDFIHLRNIALSISNWPFLLSQVFKCLKPGSWIEHCELGLVVYSDDGSVPDDYAAKVCMQLISEAMNKIGRPPCTQESITQQLKDAGFVDVQAYTYKQPMGPWPKDPRLKRIGAMSLLGGETGYAAYGLAPMTRILGMDPAQAERICAEAFASVKNKNQHAYSHYYVAFGRKPLE